MPLSEARGRIQRALRQEARTQAAWKAVWAEKEATGHTSGWLPDSLQILEDQLRDEIYFLLVASDQATRSQKALAAAGAVDTPRLRMREKITAWRDLLEHWDAPIHGHELRAVKRWDKVSSVRPGSSMSGSADGLDSITGVSLMELRHDLNQLLAFVLIQIDASFEAEWLDETNAAAYLGETMVPVAGPYGGVNWMDWPGKGRRYSKTSLDEWLLRKRQIGPRPTRRSGRRRI